MSPHGPGGWVEERPAKAAPRHNDDVLHVVRRRDYPRALCGVLVHDEFNPHRTDTAGRDRCTDCLVVLGDLRRKGEA